MRITKIILALSLIISFSNCKTETKAPSSTNTTTVTKSSSTNKVENLDVKITSADNVLIGGFTLNPIQIVANNKNYTSKNKPGKHKFYTNGQMKYEVKIKENSLKLRDKSSTLLWKVKIYPDKIKISDNEENENGFVVRPYENKIKVKRNDEELYKVKFDENKVIVNDKAAYTLSSKQDSYIYAILAIKEIPDEQKLFLIAELLNKI